MVRTSLFYLVIFVLIFLGSAKWSSEQHEYNVASSSQIAEGIKQKLLNNLDKITNQQEAKQLKADLNEADDSKRKLKSIQALTANQIFSILKIKDQKCDHNGDGYVKGDELKCLNYIWKAYIPM